MATNFPTSLDTFTNPSATDEMDDAGVLHDVQHSDKNDAIEALEAKVGIDDSGVTSSIDYKIKNEVMWAVTFNRVDLADALTDDPLEVDSSNGIRIIVLPWAGELRGISVRSAARTGGTATYEPAINDVTDVDLVAVIDGTNTQKITDTCNPGDFAFSAGDELKVLVTTSGWTPTTGDVVVTVWGTYLL